MKFTRFVVLSAGKRNYCFLFYSFINCLIAKKFISSQKESSLSTSLNSIQDTDNIVNHMAFKEKKNICQKNVT